MRHILFIILSITLSPPVYATDQEKLIDSFFSIVMIRGYNDDGSLAYGSGVVVAKNKVMTDCHIFRKTKQPWISRGEDTYSVISVQADRYHDACLVTSDSLPFQPVALGSTNGLKKGQEVVAMGHTGGSPAPLTSLGILKSIYPFYEGNIIRSTAAFSLGASGSGLFDSSGRLIGINTFKTPGKGAYYYALPVDWLASLEKLPIETKFPIEGKTFWEEEDANKPFFMQVAVPEIQEDWVKLTEVAVRWTKTEPKNTESWYELGLAYEKTGKLTEAESAYHQAVSLSATNTDALFRIGVIANAKGDKASVDAINMTLSNIDKNLAETFTAAITCRTQC